MAGKGLILNLGLATCLVTGGSGFIGSHLSEFLLKRGLRVIVVDNLITGSLKNLASFKNNPNFEFIEADITAEKIDRLEETGKIEYLYHLASPASPPQYRKFAVETLLTNSLGTFRMLELARKYKSQFLLASTSEVYGEPLIHPQKESYFGNVNPVGIRACYDEGKRFAEAITMEYKRKYDVNVRIVRIFNTYGPRMQVTDGRVVSNLITQAINNRSLTVYGAGDQTRSFCYVADMVEGIVRAMENNKTNGEVINLGNPHEIDMQELAQEVLTLTRSGSKIIKVDKRLEDDPTRRKPDIEKARNLLSWVPRVELKEGLLKTIQFFKNS